MHCSPLGLSLPHLPVVCCVLWSYDRVLAIVGPVTRWLLGDYSCRHLAVAYCRADRRLKEKDMQIEEERNRAQRAEEQLTRLNTKTKTLRRQVDDAVRSKPLIPQLPQAADNFDQNMCSINVVA